VSEPVEAAECPNCGSTAEPEQEDDVLFYACECGNHFGYRQVKQEDACAAGIPLGHLATLGRLTQAETDRLVWGGKKPASESAVFLGYPVRRGEDN
jgi:hypothetical protein